MRIRFLWPALLCAACAPPSKSRSLIASPIINGTPESRPQVVPLYTSISSTQSNACTATLIGTRTLLTAAHCLTNGIALPVAVLSEGSIGASAAHRNPAFVDNDTSEKNSESDVAVVTLSLDVADVEPARVTGNAPWVNEVVHMVGYGITSDSSSDFGTQRGGDNSIATLYDGAYEVKDTSSGRAITCHGDSGGPDFVTTNGVEWVAGVHSTSTCEDYEFAGLYDASAAASMRVDRQLDFIRTYAGANLYDGSGTYEREAPTVELGSASTTASGVPLAVHLVVSDDVRVAKVALYVDGALWGEDDVDQPTKTYDLSVALTDGAHRISALAVDGANRETTQSEDVVAGAQGTSP